MAVKYDDAVDDALGSESSEEEIDGRGRVERIVEADRVLVPTSWQASYLMYMTEAQTPKEMDESLYYVSPFWGRHVSLGNSLRREIPIGLNRYHTVCNYQRAGPKCRQIAIERAGLDVTEHQLRRGTELVGGFERQMQATSIKRESVRLKEDTVAKKKGLLSRWIKKKGEEEEESEE